VGELFDLAEKPAKLVVAIFGCRCDERKR